MGTLNAVKTVKAVKAFSTMTIAKGVAAIGDAVNAGLSRAVWFLALQQHGVNRVNIKDFRPEFDRVVIRYLETKFVGLEAWLVGAKESKGTAESPFLNTKGKKYSKRELETLIRALRAHWQNEFEKSLNGDSKKTATRTERTIMQQDVRAVYPRMVAFQKLETPTQYELNHLKLIRGVIEHAVACDPAAKAELQALEAKQSKLIK